LAVSAEEIYRRKEGMKAIEGVKEGRKKVIEEERKEGRNAVVEGRKQGFSWSMIQALSVCMYVEGETHLQGCSLK
jgi:hypothetical protein